MADPRFRPGLTPLEDRTTPSLTPAMVFAAAGQAAQADAVVAKVAAKPPYLINAWTKAFLNQYLPTLTVESQKSAAVLAEYQNSLAAEAAVNPALGPFVGRVAQARYTAEASAFRAGALTTALGGIAIRTVPPTPLNAPGPVPIPIVFDTRQPGDAAPVATDFTTAAGLTDTIPPLDSPFWMPVGDKGLRIWDVVQGVGAPITGQETAAQFFYTGYLAADGTKFNDFRTTPVPFNLAGGVIPGFQQGLIGLKPGGIRRLDIPAELGYGAAGSGDTIPPNSRLVFEVKLLGQPPSAGGTGGTTGTGTNFPTNFPGTGTTTGNFPTTGTTPGNFPTTGTTPGSQPTTGTTPGNFPPTGTTPGSQPTTGTPPTGTTTTTGGGATSGGTTGSVPPPAGTFGTGATTTDGGGLVTNGTNP